MSKNNAHRVRCEEHGQYARVRVGGGQSLKGLNLSVSGLMDDNYFCQLKIQPGQRALQEEPKLVIEISCERGTAASVAPVQTADPSPGTS